MTTEYTEPAGLSDEELLELMPQQFRGDLATVSRMAAHGAGPDVGAGLFRVSLNTGALNFARAVEAVTLARAQRQPEPGEVQELVGLIRQIALAWEPDATLLGNMTAGQLARAADLLESLSPPQPVPMSERLPGPEQPTRRHLMMLAADMGMASVDDAAEYARAVLARWGRPAPQPPADGEVAELLAWLLMQGEAQKPGPNSLLCDKTKKELHTNGARLIRVANLLAQRHPQPVPVSERLPGPEDCIPHPRTKLGTCCWGFGRLSTPPAGLPAAPLVGPRQWTLLYVETIELECSHWLPAHALPLPGEVEHG